MLMHFAAQVNSYWDLFFASLGSTGTEFTIKKEK